MLFLLKALPALRAAFSSGESKKEMKC